VERIRQGYYSDSYFVLTEELLEAEGRHPRVTMQVFARHAELRLGHSTPEPHAPSSPFFWHWRPKTGD
jgi:hypothetical protein